MPLFRCANPSRSMRRSPFIETLEARVFLSAAPAASVPFNNWAAGVPGTIEVENYDTGGEGVAFHDPTPSNQNRVYRADAVGIAPTTDAGRGYLLAWNAPGEWLNYSVNVAATAVYTLDIRFATLNGGTVHLSVDGQTASHEIRLRSTGGWNTWQTFSTPGIQLTAGQHVLRLTFDTANDPRVGVACVNWMRLRDDPAVSARTAWWRNAKYGMFVHWGLYSQLAGYWGGQTTPGYGEWIQKDLNIPESTYASIVPSHFNPTQFNAQTWVNIAKASGMKYMVVTAKHHDGFSMFNTKVSSYNVVQDTPFHQDPMAELSAACKAAGIRFGVYYSIMDWHHPELATSSTSAGAKSPNDPAVINYINNVLKPQLRELITQYHPDILWFDGEWVPWWTSEYGREITEFVQNLDPAIIINNRVGKRTSADGDFDTPEQAIPAGGSPDRLWEVAMTLNDTWGYKYNDTDWKSADTVYSDLMDIERKGGNFLLNVGPTGAGVIPSAAVAILEAVGKRLAG